MTEATVKFRPFKGNPRTVTGDALKLLADNLDRFGDLSGVVVNLESGQIVGGNQRSRIFDLNTAEIERVKIYPSPDLPGLVSEGFIVHNGKRFAFREVRWNAETEKAANVVANKSAGQWDFVALAEMFDPETLQTDFGFSAAELDFLENGFTDNSKDSAKAEEDDFTPPDDVEQIPCFIKRGDLVEIGMHRVLCGDSTNPDDVLKLMNGELADLYLTDPPYGVDNASKNSYLSGIEGMAGLWKKAFAAADLHLKTKSSFYIFSPQGSEMMMMMMMIEEVFQNKHQLIWLKNNHVLGRADYAYKHEPILFGWKKKGTHEFFGGFQTSIFEFPKPKKSELHPTMKPVALLGQLIENSTRLDALILDSFLGSGSTIMAAEQLGRRCYGLEISPHYCQIITNRVRAAFPELVIKRNGEAWDANS